MILFDSDSFLTKETHNLSRLRPLDFEKKMIAQLRKIFCKIPMNTHISIVLPR